MPWKLNKMVTYYKIHKLDNHQMIITAKYGSHHFTGYGENAFNHFPILSQWSFLLSWQPNKEADNHNFSFFFFFFFFLIPLFLN